MGTEKFRLLSHPILFQFSTLQCSVSKTTVLVGFTSSPSSSSIDPIALAVATRARACGLRVIVYDPHLPDGVAIAYGLHHVAQICSVLKNSDFLSFHWQPGSLYQNSALNDPTQDLCLDAQSIERMKKGE